MYRCRSYTIAQSQPPPRSLVSYHSQTWSILAQKTKWGIPPWKESKVKLKVWFPSWLPLWAKHWQEHTYCFRGEEKKLRQTIILCSKGGRRGCFRWVRSLYPFHPHTGRKQLCIFHFGPYEILEKINLFSLNKQNFGIMNSS